MKLDISTFIEDLKVLVELGNEIQFKLAQDPSGRKYFDVQGMSVEKNITRTQIIIESFEKDYPEALQT